MLFYSKKIFTSFWWLLKWPISVVLSVQFYRVFFNGQSPASFSLIKSFQYTVDSIQMFNVNKFLSMTRFELWPSGIGSNRTTNWATTTALNFTESLFCYNQLGCFTVKKLCPLWSFKATQCQWHFTILVWSQLRINFLGFVKFGEI